MRESKANAETGERRGAQRKTGGLKDFFLVAEISEGADVGDDEGHAELIVGAHLAESDTAVFQSEAAALAVVAELHQLILQRAVGDVVADAGGDIEAAARFAAIAGEDAHLIGKRLQDGIGLQAKMGDGSEEFAIRLDLEQRADDRNLMKLRIVFEQVLGVKESARGNLEIADDGGRVARSQSESKGRDRVQGVEDVALAVENCAAKGGIEIMLLHQTPGKQLLGLIVVRFHPQALSNAVLHFIGVGAGGIGVEADELLKIIDAGDVAIDDFRFNGVLVAPAVPGFGGWSRAEEPLEGRETQIEHKLAVVAHQGLSADGPRGSERVSVISAAKGGGGGGVKPRSEMKRKGNARRELHARNKIRSLNRQVCGAGNETKVVALNGTGEGVESKIKGQTAPGLLLDRAEPDLRGVTQCHA